MGVQDYQDRQDIWFQKHREKRKGMQTVNTTSGTTFPLKALLIPKEGKLGRKEHQRGSEGKQSFGQAHRAGRGGEIKHQDFSTEEAPLT